ncbi:hypothetical protein PHYSODRAFT_249155 [Phytophthora sojae]|uniref:RxLR effector protein n=1 Tax=Phytophthora sojae (strain P6497) TaxID=1094619 RepID=G4ZP81_PHYSP|nr:hypothetical protein PHYSODRAFT_249155 [Phytophthora sojae]EGZ15121.1 hypothetical protein PHYSODRAFT_249155 [Phytophthora sojae]|eukprot:XP_009528870.1 hypothetical protein PHYSODRAFT_249155 [Phytophthora sojae]
MFGVNMGFIDDAVNNVLETVDDISDSIHVKALQDGLQKEKTRPDQTFKALPDGLQREESQEGGLIKLLASLDDGPGATKFKEEVVTSWLSNPDHPINMLKRLKLDDAGDDLLASPLLDVWTRHLKAFNKEYPFAETTMIQTLTKSYGDEKLAAIIQAGTKVPKTEQLAKNLQVAQFKRWMGGFPNADIWRAYCKAYGKEFPGKLFSFRPDRK